MIRPTALDDVIVAHAAIVAAFGAHPRRVARHIIASALVTLNHDSAARASSQMPPVTGVAEGDAVPHLSATPPLIGTYHDRLVFTDRGWRFAERRGRLDLRAPQLGWS